MTTFEQHPSLQTRLRELFHYRYLIGNLVSRNLKTRYKNSVLGIAWSMLNPLGMMLVFTLVFTVLAPGGMDVEAPAAFILAGLLPWNFFSGTVVAATSSLVDNSNLIKKVYFPREVLPLSVLLSNLVHFLIALPLYFLLAILMGIPGAEGGNFFPFLLWLPVIVVVQAMFILGFSLITATVNVFYRDMSIVMDTVILAWFFMTPVFYDFSETLASTQHFLGMDIPLSRIAFILNPMASIIAAYRDSIYFARPIDDLFLLRTGLTALIFLVMGFWFFHRYNWRFGEEL